VPIPAARSPRREQENYSGLCDYVRVAGFQLQPSSASGRLLMVTTLLFSLLLYNSYSAVLMASLAVTNPTLPFSNLDEVAKKGTHALCVRNLSYAYMRLKVSVLCFLYGPGKSSRYSDSLRAGRSGDRIPKEARFSAPVQTGSEAHPASYIMGTVSFPVVKRPGCGVGHPQTRSAEVKERVELYLYSPSGPSWPVIG
jgi:predicted metal-binding protein